MKKNILLIILYFSAFTAGIAQSKMNFSFAKNMNDNETDRNEQVHMLIQGDVLQIKGLVEDVGGIFKFSTSNIASVSISINQLSQIISNKAIQRVEAFPPSTHPLNDSALLNANVYPIQNGQAPLSQAYDGTGVIIGFIETGIDLTHKDFQDSFGKTRILFLWDQTVIPALNTPTVPILAYGREWSNTDIDAGLAVSHKDDPTGHGTHVAGTAVGNGLATGKFKGVAPKADIIVVAYGNAQPKTVDAVYYIYTKAKSLGKPCVINASYGGDQGLHDGRDLESMAVQSLINQNPGQAFIAAAGNSGAKGKCHLAYTVSATDTNFTLFAPISGWVYFDIVADSNNMKNIKFAIGADNMAAPHSFRGNIPFTNVASMPLATAITTNLMKAGKRIGIVQSTLTSIGGDYILEYIIKPDSTSYNWRLMATGTGNFDLWNYTPTAIAGYSPIVSSIPSVATMPDSMYYKYPDSDKSIQGGFQCIDEVVAVGYFISRANYVDCNNNPENIPGSVTGQLSPFSSIGPTRDGRMKPEITAPGDLVLSAKSVSIVGSPLFKSAEGCKHIRSGGTSHACPVVAGIAALYLQKNPTATAAQVKQAIIRCTIKDQYTGNSLPDKYWGYGKVDGFRTLTDCITIVITTQPRDTSICENDNATFSIAAIGTGLRYQWQVDHGAGYVNLTNAAPYSGINRDTLTISSAASGLTGNHYRCVVNDTYSYTATSNFGNLIVHPLPTITANAATACFNTNAQTTPLTYSATTNLPTTYSISWAAAATTVGFAPVSNTALPLSPIIISVPASTAINSYTGTITVKNANTCVSKPGTVFSVIVHSLPVVTSGGLAVNYCYDAAVQTLTGSPAGGTFSGTGITNAATGTFDPVIAGSGLKTITYSYTDANNCSGASSHSTTVLTKAASVDSCKTVVISSMDANIANTFTPNNDGVNDEFKVNYTGTPASDFNLTIFDRWGTLVFSSTNPNIKWDGRTTAGIKVTTGTYFYVLVNAGISYKGNVALFE